MPFSVFNRQAQDTGIDLRVESGIESRKGRDYLASEPLENAVNVAIALGRPLLVSGEPGCGKTELGYAIARKIGIPRLHFFSVKSDSEARNLFYEYDTVGRFHAAQVGRVAAGRDQQPPDADARHFIEYRALGRAILDAYEAGAVEHLLAGRYEHPQRPQRSIVVIDEIDKAPRDFPNDVLNEIEQFWFRVPELGFGTRIAPETPRREIAAAVRPIIIITSNSERQLPDAFLRRCVYHHITFPDDETLKGIVRARLMALGAQLADEDLHRAFHLVERARQAAIEKRPGTAELIDFVLALSDHRASAPTEAQDERFRACLSALAKTEHDARVVAQLLPDLRATVPR